MRNKRILLILLTAVLLFSGCKIWLPWTKRVDMTRATPEGLYQQGVEYYQDGSYKKAVDLFQRLKEEYPLSKYAIMGEMGIADSYFSGKQYVEAELAYSEFLNLHPTNENLPYVLYQIGMCHFNQITTIDRDQSEAFKALRELERLEARFPSSKFAFLAEKMIRECKKTLGEQEFYVGQFYFNIKEYRAALQRFEKVAREYPNVGLDYKVSYFLIETKRRLAEAESKSTAGKK
ncbi:MAG: outer membrane protein assembly factor BamD [Proteobacteria bacterium]|nr:outer membrane protein assembly factor BamD [Pseudomonadota bacterium]MBU4121873.1 outer membrane protein assembly factor BamD [Pseudomonadota bacterium]